MLICDLVKFELLDEIEGRGCEVVGYADDLIINEGQYLNIIQRIQSIVETWFVKNVENEILAER